MFTNTQDAGKEIDAGFYMRARKQIRSWSWSWGRSHDQREPGLVRPAIRGHKPGAIGF